MPELNVHQKKKRGQILQQMADQYWHTQRPWLKRDQAYVSFADTLEKDPVKLRIINALAASCTPKEEPHVQT
jgi:hypothetical protein